MTMHRRSRLTTRLRASLCVVFLATLMRFGFAQDADADADPTSTTTPQEHTDAPEQTEWLASALPLFRARSIECAACQKMYAWYDEHLMLALMDAAKRSSRASASSSSFASKYGELEEVIEEAVPEVCSAGSIALNATIRSACRRMIEKSEDDVVALYYAAGARLRDGAEEGALGEALCGPRGALGGACVDNNVARWTTAELEVLEVESGKVSVFDFNHEQAPGTAKEFKSEPALALAKKDEPAGTVLKIVASDFYKRVIFDRDRDALMYFSYPTMAKEFHEAYSQTHARVAEALEDAEDLFVGQLDVEKNDVPPPYASRVETPSVLLYRARKKENPRWIPLRTPAGEYITGESAPTLADVLTMVSKHGKTAATREAADAAMIRASKEELYASRRDRDEL